MEIETWVYSGDCYYAVLVLGYGFGRAGQGDWLLVGVLTVQALDLESVGFSKLSAALQVRVSVRMKVSVQESMNR